MNAASEKIVHQKRKSFLFLFALIFSKTGLDLDWLLQLDLLLGQLLDLLVEEGPAPGAGPPAAEVGLPAAEVGPPAAEVRLPCEAGPLSGVPPS